jgi:ketosteroid isomerase-like protein
MMTTQEIANQLVALCRAGKNIEAVDTLLSDDVVSVEAVGNEAVPAVMNGRSAIRGKNEWWINNHTVHSAQVKGPYPNGDRFAVFYDFTVTPLAGEGAGKKMRMQEVALYTVTDGKVSREEFFYDMTGGGDPIEEEPAKKPTAKKAAKKTAKKAVKKAAKKAAKKAPKAKAKAKSSKGKAKPKAKAKAKTKSKSRRR